MSLKACSKYKVFKADGQGGGEELYESLRSTAIEKYLLKENLPIDLDYNNYYVECHHHEETEQIKRVSLYEFKDMCFNGEVKDNRGAYTMRKG